MLSSVGVRVCISMRASPEACSTMGHQNGGCSLDAYGSYLDCYNSSYQLPCGSGHSGQWGLQDYYGYMSCTIVWAYCVYRSYSKL